MRCLFIVTFKNNIRKHIKHKQKYEYVMLQQPLPL
jgi:hypothetical protein